ncbi:hypothetical protein C0Q70_03801 [Pomacea canaliculata]|uniref:RING-type domain-containing protein n=1 Tax=Pomacea canaliculata TaxID=400727 RepID=A0A2T7PTQ7_POMCA|nr:hypothetical protein C0Q70_03801 [Pomacea canaliculata]
MATVVQIYDTECTVCNNGFKVPKILPCGHLLCRECVISWMDSKSYAGCPFCTCPIAGHQVHSSQSSANIADALPTDPVIETIAESAQVLVQNNMCTICDDVTAEYICIQCVEKMCPSCMKIHKKMSISRSHDVESVITVTPERLAASRPALCADHGDKQADIFCSDHNLVICKSCFSNKHSQCQDVMYLDEKMKSADNILGSLREELSKAEDNFKQAIGNLHERVQTANVAKQKNMALVDKTCDRLQEVVEECRKQLKKLISDSIGKFNNSLYDVKIELEKRLGKVTSHKHLVTRATTVRPRPALIHAAQTLPDRVNSLDFSNELEVEACVNPWPEVKKHCEDVVKVMNVKLQRLQQHLTDAEGCAPDNGLGHLPALDNVNGKNYK